MPNTTELDRQMESFQKEFRRVHQEISKVIVGYSDVIDDILMTILGKGHVLLEGVPDWERQSLFKRSAMRCIFDRRGFNSLPI